MKRKLIRYRGEVQGIGFRANAIHQGRGLAITGFVRNEPNGDVIMDVQGTTQDVREFIKRVGETMKSKIAETIIEEQTPSTDRTRFRIS